MAEAAPREESTAAEPHMELVATIEGVLSEGVCTAPFKVAIGEQEFGEWEYVAVARVPDRDVAKTAPKPLLVKNRGPRLRIDLEIDPDSPQAFDDKVTLSSAAGYDCTLGVVAEGRAHAHAKGMATLIFEGVKVGDRYTCIVDPGMEGRPYALFKDVAIEEGHLMPALGGDL